jgi:sulfite reductase (NADPH) flavoprotein alpha-component
MTLIDSSIPMQQTMPAGKFALPVLPETAPFTSAQRAWLNGYFAGLLGNLVPPEDGAPAPSTGAQAVVEKEETFPWHEPALPLAERLKLAEDRPHARRLMAAMAQLDCGACGYVCQTYAEAIARGEEKDLTRCTPGGRETARALKQLIAAAPASPVEAKATPTPASTTRPSSPSTPAHSSTPAAWDRNNPYPARLVRCERLTGRSSAKDTRLVVLDLKGSGLTYKVGDALGVYPENCPALVLAIIEALHATGAEDVCGWDGQPVSLYEALLRDYTITRPAPALLQAMSERAADPAELLALAALRDDETGPPPGLQVLDLLRRFPSARLSADEFVTALSPLAPRLYSISSSLRVHADQVHLTVSAVRYTNERGLPCKGVASTYLADRVRPGMKVRVFLHPAHKFSLCAADRPIIMVGPGTGIAPFRAFLQERFSTRATGGSWLFFGDQHASSDFLYREELERYRADGTLTRLDTAFSRDGEEKVYVQHRMAQEAAELWAWLGRGAVFYVCGVAQRMASDVDKTLRRIIGEQGGLSAAEVDRYVAEMVRSGRYQRDVY